MATATVFLALVASGCGTPVVQVSDVPQPDGQDAASCAALTAALPKRVGDKLDKRTVEPKSPLIAAWGKPAVVLRCGVGIPTTYRPGVDLTIVNNIGWFEDDRQDDVVYTTITRQPRVALAVPRAQASSFEILVDIADVVGAHTQGPDLTAQ
ncbi:MAG TPA: DUF3515 domain-containing protein [Frankiaceae bacterium]|nr:DUF3515 domain-containing protein [Frankiaceae bacterium]